MVAVFAGHLHGGGYALDGEGIHHVTVESPLTHDEAFGYVDVFADRLELVGSVCTKAPRALPFPAPHAVPPTATPSSRL